MDAKVGTGVEYLVAFTIAIHQAGNPDNGSEIYMESFDNETDATNFYNQLVYWLRDKANTVFFAAKYIHDGYLSDVIGLYRLKQQPVIAKEYAINDSVSLVMDSNGVVVIKVSNDEPGSTDAPQWSTLTIHEVERLMMALSHVSKTMLR